MLPKLRQSLLKSQEGIKTYPKGIVKRLFSGRVTAQFVE